MKHLWATNNKGKMILSEEGKVDENLEPIPKPTACTTFMKVLKVILVVEFALFLGWAFCSLYLLKVKDSSHLKKTEPDLYHASAFQNSLQYSDKVPESSNDLSKTKLQELLNENKKKDSSKVSEPLSTKKEELPLTSDSVSENTREIDNNFKLKSSIDVNEPSYKKIDIEDSKEDSKEITANSKRSYDDVNKPTKIETVIEDSKKDSKKIEDDSKETGKTTEKPIEKEEPKIGDNLETLNGENKSPDTHFRKYIFRFSIPAEKDSEEGENKVSQDSENPSSFPFSFRFFVSGDNLDKNSNETAESSGKKDSVIDSEKRSSEEGFLNLFDSGEKDIYDSFEKLNNFFNELRNKNSDEEVDSKKDSSEEYLLPFQQLWNMNLENLEEKPESSENQKLGALVSLNSLLNHNNFLKEEINNRDKSIENPKPYFLDNYSPSWESQSGEKKIYDSLGELKNLMMGVKNKDSEKVDLKLKDQFNKLDNILAELENRYTQEAISQKLSQEKSPLFPSIWNTNSENWSEENPKSDENVNFGFVDPLNHLFDSGNFGKQANDNSFVNSEISLPEKIDIQQIPFIYGPQIWSDNSEYPSSDNLFGDSIENSRLPLPETVIQDSEEVEPKRIFIGENPIPIQPIGIVNSENFGNEKQDDGNVNLDFIPPTHALFNSNFGKQANDNEGAVNPEVNIPENIVIPVPSDHLLPPFESIGSNNNFEFQPKEKVENAWGPLLQTVNQDSGKVEPAGVTFDVEPSSVEQNFPSAQENYDEYDENQSFSPMDYAFL